MNVVTAKNQKAPPLSQLGTTS